MTTDTDKLVEMAQLFHDTYEALAPAFGYETRPDTKAFDPESPNGKLMCATVAKVRTAVIASLCGDVEPVGEAFVGVNGQHLSFSKTFGYLKCCPEDEASGCTIRPVYSASTVAALKAERDAALAAGKVLTDYILSSPSGCLPQSIATAIAALTKGQP